MASKQLIDIIIKAEDQASQTAEKVDNSLRKIGDTSSKFSRIPGFDALKSKLSSVATTLDGKLGGALTKARNHFNNFKGNVTSVASTLKGKLGGAVDGIRNKLTKLSGGAKGLSSAFGFLKGAVSMTVGMLGYDLVNSIMQSARASLNARSSMQAFAQRLKMSATEVQEYQKSLDSLQASYKKIDMDVVGQQATDMAFRLGLPKESLTELTETTAIFTDAMQRNGRSAEDSMLAMSDAMDGQFVRLKELGIGQDDLMKNGWSGDINDKTGLLKAMNKALKEQHYDELAKSVDTLDDAWQVLSVTMGNLLEAILLPLTPVIVGVVNALTGVVDGIKGFVGTLQGAFSNLPEWAQIGIGIGAVAIAVGLVIASMGGLAAASAAVIGPLSAVAATMLAIEWPIVAVVAAIGLVVAAIYEIGKAFGWWTDVSSMLDAVWAGIQRLWSAFINHPDVQGAIAFISSAFQWLGSVITAAWNALMDFLGVSTGGEFDVVHAIIVGIGEAWNMITAPIRAIIGLITSLVSIFSQLSSGQIDLQTTIGLVWNALVTFFQTMTQSIFFIMLQFAANLLTAAVQAGMNLLNGVVQYVSRLPGRVLTYLLNVATRITAMGARWVSIARQKANQMVVGIITYLMTLPGRVYSALMGVVGRITGAIGHWVTSAASKVKEVIKAITSPFSGVASAISGALSGVANAIKAPFETAWNTVKPLVDKIQGAMKLVGAAGGEPAYGGETLDVNANRNFTISTGEYIVDDSPIVIEDNINLTLDLSGVPRGVNTAELVNAIQDRDVLNALVSNRDFQDLDARVKQRINLKNVRARGR